MEHSPCEAISSIACQEISTFMEPRGSLLHSQVPATHPYSEPDEFSPHCHTH
jgi:hypothetical protein